MTLISTHQLYTVGGMSLFLALIAFLAMLRTRPMRGAFSALLRPFVSSWRFFDQVTELPVMQIREVSADGTLGEWRNAILAPRVRSWNLLYHPHGNVFHAKQTLLQQSFIELTAEKRPTQLVEETSAFQLLRHLAETSRSDDIPPAAFQFRVGYELGDVFEDHLISPVIQ
ncbi:MAG: hypothetical protein IT290_03735 [Deltaproteobacteria bacterium]|nr:hypothetical protein [Deltaproteobacteria bacterium]